MDKEQVIELVKRYADIIKEYFDISRVVLFGSYIKGTQKEWSDIDVAVFLKEKSEDIINDEFKLYKLRRDINSRIEPVILNEENDPTGFVKEVLRTGIVIYQSN
jgi:uncharacterized protein